MVKSMDKDVKNSSKVMSMPANGKMVGVQAKVATNSYQVGSTKVKFGIVNHTDSGR